MAYKFKKLSEVDKIEELSDSASVLVEDGGEVKRVTKDKVGGGSGGYTEHIENAKIVDNASVTVSDGWAFIVTFTPFEGEVYVVTIDGAEYTVTAKKNDYGEIILGSEPLWLIGDGEYDENEPPFYYYDGSFSTPENGTYTVSIVGSLDVIHKIDERYYGPTVYYVDREAELFYKDRNHTEPISNAEFKRAYLGGGVLLADGSGCLSAPLFAISDVGDNGEWGVAYYCFELRGEILQAYNYTGNNDGGNNGPS